MLIRFLKDLGDFIFYIIFTPIVWLAEALELKCTNCGGKELFDSDYNFYYCEDCGGERRNRP